MKNLNLILEVVLLSASIASASSILTYTESVVGSGSFNGTAFSGQTVTISETANTSGIALFGGGVYDLPGTVSVNVPGIGTGTFTDSMFVFSNQNAADGGFFDSTRGINLAFNDNAAFATYALATAIGPLSGTSFVDTTDTYATTLGNFSFSSAASTATFTAAGSAVPEPGTMGLLGIGLAAVVAGRRLLAR
ncbi:MAG TPA: PEP-CTERM sorting domain-containing protein [Bryobacteraceae bacterium]|nr:PEP-CTERM sorting domain-containing protein [Bryobacteraceae bacterium]